MTFQTMDTSSSLLEDPIYRRITEPASFKFRLLNNLFMRFCKPFFSYYCPLTILGHENIPIEPFIFCSNHTSHMDSTVLMIASGLPFQQSAMVAAQDYFFQHNKKRNITQMLLNLIPIDRNASKESMLVSIKLCEAFIAQGNQNLIIYPEGTRSTDGELQPFKKGTAWIALRLHMPIVPAYIHGTFAAMPKGTRFPRPRRLTVTIGKPLYPQNYMQVNQDGVKRTNSQSYRQLTDDVCLQVQQLKEQTIGS